MNDIIERITGMYVYLKSYKVLKRINGMLDFPVQSKKIKNVLVILPRGLNHLDEANDFVQKLRKHYQHWKIKIFDVDKIHKDNLNLLSVPKQGIIQKIKNTNYHLVIDLNEQLDTISAFIAAMSEAGYRIAFNKQDQNYFNMQCHAANNKNGFFYQSLLDYVQRLFI